MNNFSKICLFLFLIILIIPFSYANENITLDDDMLSLSDSDDILYSSDIYFDSSASVDGNGSQSSPYNHLESTRLKDDSVAYFAAGEYTLDKQMSFGNLTVIGQSPLNTVINGNSLRLNSNNIISVFNITLNSIPIYNTNKFIANNVVFENDDGSYRGSYGNIFGGAIYSNNADTMIYSSIFKNNNATYGGAIYADNSNLTVIDSVFQNNYAYKYGGAIAGEKSSSLNIINSTFINCYTMTNAGGALYSKNSKLNVERSNFTSCNATFGGAICDLESDSNVNSIIADNNIADYQGGAIYKMYGTMNVTSSSFTSNKASSGGAVFIDNSSEIIIKSSKFTSNEAFNEGGAIYTILNIKQSISSNTYKNNKASKENNHYNSSGYNLFIGNGNYTQFVGDFSFNGTLPSKYDLRDYGWVTPVKHQKGSGNCWAFTSIGALESCILKAAGISYDLSEENMKNVMAYYSDYGWKLTTNKGGYDDMGVGYLVSWLGAFEEDLETFSDNTVLSPVLNSSIHVQNLIYLTRSNFTDNGAVKEALIKYGAVATGIYYYGSYMKSNSYYYSGSTGPNHAVLIVGWDDTYSKSNFRNAPPGDGAWICKNSWGETWGDKGYFYVSYYDTKCVRVGDYDKSTYTIILNDTVRYDKNYQYDIIGITDYLITGMDTIWYENIFNATENELLTAFSTYFNMTTEWTAQIFVNDVLKLTQNGVSDAGYYTFNLNEFIPLKTGDTFKILIKISTDKYASFPISERVRSNRILYSEGVSFFSYDGINWTDLYDFKYEATEFQHTYESQVACIKAFTTTHLTSNITLDIPEFVAVDNPLNLTAIVKDQYGNLINFGSVTFTVDSKTYTVPVSNGKAILKTRFDSLKEYDVLANYIENDYYFNSSTSGTVNVTVKSADLTLGIGDITYGEKIIVYNSLLSNGTKISGNINVVINSKSYSIPSNSKTQIDDILMPNTYVANAYYSNIAAANTTFNVNKIPIKMDLSILKTDVDAVNMTAKLSKPVNGSVIFTVNSKSYPVNAKNGIAILSLTDLDYGNYNVNAIFSSDIYYNASDSDKFSVNSVKTHLNANDVIMYYQDGSRFYVTLLDKNNKPLANQNLIIRLNGVDNKRTTNENGTTSIAVNLNSNVYEVFVKYEGDEKYLSSNLTRNITVKSTILSSDVVKYFRNDTQFYVTVLDFKGNKVANTVVEMNINGVFYKRTTNSEGVARLNINLEPNVYIITVTNPVTGEMASNNITVLSRLVDNHDLVKYYKNASKYTVRVLDEKGNPLIGVYVKFNINGVFYERITNSDGVAGLNINLGPNTYIITAQYGESKVSNKIKVLTVIETEDVVMKYRDGTKFKALILDGVGNPNPGVEVTFNINGVLYNRISNSTGVVNLNINLQAGKYIITTMYNGLSVSNTITIRNI